MGLFTILRLNISLPIMESAATVSNAVVNAAVSGIYDGKKLLSQGFLCLWSLLSQLNHW